ncbi:MAG: hypothetical protein JSR66_05675 [Proteobacteria bacterium]|nr:hypothetical protein [Pseudomonadota bacterium]
MVPQVSWLLLEGLLPLFGAGVIYLVWGVCTYAAAVETSEFTYRWGEAADPLGWLYGATMIAAQNAVRDFTLSSHRLALGWGCVVVGIICLLLLVAAMTNRGATWTWRPKCIFQAFTIVFVGTTLYIGFLSHTPSLR